MGGLHEGHLSLVRVAAAAGRPVVTSIFVNRLQFAPTEDFARYPRTFDRDVQLLEGAGCDAVFAPSEIELYPEPQLFKVLPSAQLAAVLEGAVRPDFFAGVCTVVLKLLHIVQPHAAIFGKKDYQQLLVLRAMVRQLALPVAMIAAETVRASDGLALSSRNTYLTDDQRRQAPELYATLCQMAASLRAGVSAQQIEAEALQILTSRGWQPDYVAVRRQADLGSAEGQEPRVILAAATLGGTRLIDNIEV
jgi:pantoate--beta-alanine ligase